MRFKLGVPGVPAVGVPEDSTGVVDTIGDTVGMADPPGDAEGFLGARFFEG